MHLRLKMCLASWGAFSCAWVPSASAQTALPQVDVTVASPIRRAPARPAPVQPGPTEPAPAQPAPAPETLQGTIPIITDQFATITVVPNDELRRNGASTLGGLLFEKPGITGSSFAPGASSRPIIRGLDVNRVRIQEDGIGANGASDLGEDHFVPVDPLTSNQVEVIRGPATLRFGSQAIGGVVESTNNRVPTYIPGRGISAEFRGAGTSVDSGLDGAALLDAGGGNFAIHADAFGRTATRLSHPKLSLSDAAQIRRTRPMPHNPAISMVTSQILRRTVTARRSAPRIFLTMAILASRSHKTMRFITFPESMAKTTTPVSTRIKPNS